METTQHLATRDDVIRALATVGVYYRFVYSPAHWNIMPYRNFDKWTDKQMDTIRLAMRSIGCHCVREIVVMASNGKSFSSFIAEDGKGLRIVRDF